jgi:hypothetical protein
MKYFKIDIQTRFPELGKISSSVNGKNIPSNEDFFWEMNKGEILYDTPIFDYFILESYDKKEYWEWALFDVHDFIGEGSQIPGWLISKRLKDLFKDFKIAVPHFYYLSKLLYKDKKIDYYIFQFSGKGFRSSLTNYINFSKSIFYDPNHKTNFTVQNEKELLMQQEKILEESGFDVINIPIERLVLNEDVDFISMQNFLGDKIISERLKQAIEENSIEGFEFSELDYEVVVNE